MVREPTSVCGTSALEVLIRGLDANEPATFEASGVKEQQRGNAPHAELLGELGIPGHIDQGGRGLLPELGELRIRGDGLLIQ